VVSMQYFKINKNKTMIIKILFFLLYIVLLFFIAKSHEPWFDEAQSWMISSDFSFDILQSEGHPCLWYLLEGLFIKCGLTYEHVWVIPFSLSVISSFILIFFVKMDNKIKFLFLLTPTILYFSNCFARVYSLITLLMILLMVVYPKRIKHPYIYGLLLLLLINSHVLVCGLVGALLLIDLYDLIKNKEESLLISLTISIIGIVLLVMQLYKCIGMNGDVLVSSNGKYLLFFSLFVTDSLESQTKSKLFELILILAFFSLVYRLFKNKEYKIIFLLIFPYLYLLIVCSFIYVNGFMNHMSVVLFSSILLSFLVLNIKTNYYNMYFFIIFGSLLFGSGYYIYKDYKYDYSGSYEAYKYIEDNIPVGSNIYCYSIKLCTALKPYDVNNDYNFIDYKTNEEIFYVKHHLTTYYCDKINEDYDRSIEYYIEDLELKKAYKCYDINDYEILYESSKKKTIEDGYLVLYLKNK